MKQEIKTTESTGTEPIPTKSVIAIITSIGLSNAPANKTNIGLGNKKLVYILKKGNQNRKQEKGRKVSSR
ncbi:MAG: hypothetical protein IPH46_05725 [Bacteroidetes bacterium]|nr:hypothetical protein [Bacteroidota bacterium]